MISLSMGRVTDLEEWKFELSKSFTLKGRVLWGLEMIPSHSLHDWTSLYPSLSFLFIFLFQADRAEHPAGGDGARADGDAGGEDGDGPRGGRRGAGLRRRRLAHPQILVSYLN